MQFELLHDMGQWHGLKARVAEARGAVVLKKSPTCPGSLEVEKMVETWAAQLAEESDLLLVKVDVKAHQWLSQLIAEELHVKHESPQVIWLTPEWQVKWHRSHRNIKIEDLQQLAAE